MFPQDIRRYLRVATAAALSMVSSAISQAEPPPAFILTWGSQGSEPSQFQNPDGIAVDGSGSVYVADTQNHRIQKFTSSGAFQNEWGGLEYPCCARFAGGHVYVIEQLRNRVVKFTTDGVEVGAFYTGVTNAPGFALDADGNVYVADFPGHRIKKFDPSGSLLLTWGSQGSADGQFEYPIGVGVGPDGNVYVADRGNSRVEKFTPTGGFLAAWGSAGSGSGQFGDMWDIAFDVAGSVYVTDRGNNRVQKFTNDGDFLVAWGSPGTGEGEFGDNGSPTGIAVDPDGHVYVADRGNARVQKFGSDGSWAEFAPAGTLPMARVGHTSVFDPVRGRMVVFGGRIDPDEVPFRNDVWALSRTGPVAWEQLSPAGPPPPGRVVHTAIYDPVGDRMVVFGGVETAGGPKNNEVWTLTLAGTPTWTHLLPAGTPPSARSSHSAVHDPQRNRMIVFGGEASYELQDDVWALSLSGSPVWTQLPPSGGPPSGRQGHSAIYDPVRDRMVVFGGTDAAGSKSDVWALSLGGTAAWEQLSPNGATPARTQHTSVYEPVRDRMVVFGGMAQGFDNDTWSLSLAGTPAWADLLPEGTRPSGRIYHSAIYDPAQDRMVVFAGGGSHGIKNNEVWALTWGNPPPPGGVNVDPTEGLVTTESGGTATFDVVLTSQPMADVTIGLSSSDPTEGTVSPASVSFTSANWNVAQEVIVTGVDDAELDAAVVYTIVTAAATSADPSYTGLNTADVSVMNSDDDCWPFPLSYVDFSSINGSGGSPTAIDVGFYLDQPRAVLLDDHDGPCWDLQSPSHPLLAGCMAQSATIELNRTNPYDYKCLVYKVPFTLRDDFTGEVIANASHLVVDDSPLLNLSDWKGHVDLIGLVTDHAPILKFHTGERYWPVTVDVSLHNARLRTNGPGAPANTPAFPNQTLTQDDLARYSWSFLTLDMEGDPIVPDDLYASYLAAREATTLPYCVYATAILAEGRGTQTTDDDIIIVQYWMHYYYNDWSPYGGQLRLVHEGDWEHVSIAFDASLQPRKMYFGSHQAHVKSWEDVHKWPTDNNRPVVYVALGSHGNYARTTPTANQLGDEFDGAGEVFGDDPVERRIEVMPRWADPRPVGVANRWIEYSGYWGTGPRYKDENGYDDVRGTYMGAIGIGVAECWRGPAMRQAWVDPYRKEFKNQRITARGSVDIVVTDPHGRICSRDATTIPRATYETPLPDGAAVDGGHYAEVVIADPLAGEYHVSAMPLAVGSVKKADQGAFSLWATRERLEAPTETIVLADSIPTDSIPAQGYSFIPDVPYVGTSEVVPGVLDLGWPPTDSTGMVLRLTAGDEGFNVSQLIPESLRFNGTVAPMLPVAAHGDTLDVRFPRGPAVQSILDAMPGTSRRVLLTGLFADSVLRLESPAAVDLVRVTGVGDLPATPRMFHVGSARPNPGDGVFKLPVDVTSPGGRLQASVVDVKGRLIAKLADGVFNPGRHWIAWRGVDREGAAVASGMYWIVVTFDGQRHSARVTVLR